MACVFLFSITPYQKFFNLLNGLNKKYTNLLNLLSKLCIFAKDFLILKNYGTTFKPTFTSFISSKHAF